MGSIKNSTDYSWFKFLGNNRKLSKRHINNLRDQFAEYGNITEISPILVNDKGFIIDGQHRFALCQELNLPVFYNEVDSKKEITPAINSNQKRWAAVDYLNFFAPFKKEYRLLSEFMQRNEISYSMAGPVLFPEKSANVIFAQLTKGTLEVSDRLEEGQKRMDIIHDMHDLTGEMPTERYARGLLRCMYMDNFEIERFLTKVKMMMAGPSRTSVRPRATAAADVLRNIETIYNFKTREEATVLLFR